MQARSTQVLEDCLTPVKQRLGLRNCPALSPWLNTMCVGLGRLHVPRFTVWLHNLLVVLLVLVVLVVVVVCCCYVCQWKVSVLV